MSNKLYGKVYRRGCPTTIAFDATGKIKPILCGKWDCPRCARDNAKMWAWRVSIQLKDRDGNAWHWVFTMSPKIKSKEYAYEILPKLWDALRKAVQRAVGKFTYCAFVEGQPKRSHMPHFHVISLTRSPRTIKRMAVAAGFGWRAWNEPITGPKASRYVAKYTSKGDAGMPKGFRRCRTSKDWAKLPPFSGSPYLVPSREESTLSFLLRVEAKTGVDIKVLSDRWMDSWEDFLQVDNT